MGDLSRRIPLLLLLVVWGVVSCSADLTPTPDTVATQAVEASKPENTQTSPTESLPPTDHPAPADTSALNPMPFEPVLVAEFSGVGTSAADDPTDSDSTTETFSTPACRKAVFTWSVEPNDEGIAMLDIHMHRVEYGTTDSLVDVLEMDTQGVVTGTSFRGLRAGDYYFTVDGHTGPWTIRATCFDGQPAESDSVDLQGTGSMVSGNFALPKCAKSVFRWTVEPDSSGHAVLVGYLYSVDRQHGSGFIKGVDLDATTLFSGEALEPLSGNIYFIVIERNSGPWTITWECRD